MQVHGKTESPLRFKNRNSNQMKVATRASLENAQTNLRSLRPFSEVTNLGPGSKMCMDYAAALFLVGRLYVISAGRQIQSFEVSRSLLT
jgi:hypothetical protein